MGKSPMNVVVLLGVGEGQAGMAETDRAPVLLLSDRRFVTDGESSAVARHAITAWTLITAGGHCRPCRPDQGVLGRRRSAAPDGCIGSARG